MSFKDFVDKSKYQYDRHGPSVLPQIGTDFVASAIGKVPYVTTIGRKIFDYEWDVLLVLDACRWDMYEDLVGTGEKVWSAGSSSPEWMKNQFNRPETSETAYVTGNLFSQDHARDRFALLDEVWKYRWDDERGTVPPEPITDRVIDVARNGSYDRVIGHYMQPHFPFIGREGDEQFGRMRKENHNNSNVARYDDPWLEMFYNDAYELDALRDAYWANLAYVWKHVETILENVDGTVVVTADHGNAMGEFGLWGHQPGFLHPQMRWVPWDVRQASDSGAYEPTIDPEEEVEDYDRTKQLHDLGYL